MQASTFFRLFRQYNCLPEISQRALLCFHCGAGMKAGGFVFKQAADGCIKQGLPPYS
jgi:hypothetical protein